MNEVVYYVVQFVIIFVIGLISKYLIPWLKTKSDNEALLHIEEWVKTAVSAAEQVFIGRYQGASKKEFVLTNLHKLLNDKGIKITEDQLNILIEAAVKALNNNHIGTAESKPQLTDEHIED